MEPDNPNGKLDNSFKNSYMNAWIDPDGNIYEVGMMGHSSFACEYLLDVYEKVKASGHNIVDYLMQELGWMRVMTWSNKICKVINNQYGKEIKFTKKQKYSLFDLCIKYDSDIYKEYFDEA